MLLEKGYTIIAESETCDRQFEVMNSEYVYEDSLIDLTAEKFWMTYLEGVDSVSEIKLKDSTILIYSKETSKWDGLYQEMIEGDVGYQVLVIGYGTEITNPYFQKAIFSCWQLGSDDYLDYENVYIWTFLEWKKVISWESLMRFKYKFVEPPYPPLGRDCFFCFKTN